ncbi:MAG: HlyD family efflux transporter periplasmic adaptor subunit [Pirellulaceae bacterium]
MEQPVTAKTQPRLGIIVQLLVSFLLVGGATAATSILVYIKEPPKNKPVAVLIPTVETFAIEEHHGNLDLTVSGSVVPFREIKIAAEVGGMITEKKDICRAGNYVEKDTDLLTIDRKSYEIEAQTLQAELTQSEKMIVETVKEIEGLKAQIALANEELELLNEEYDRNQNLKGVVSRSELDQSQRSVLSSRSQLTSLKKTLETAEARKLRMDAALELSARRLERANLNLAKTIIRAPAKGVIVKESVQQGEVVAAGTQLLVFEDTQKAEVVCNLSKTDVDWIRQNSKSVETPNDGIQSAYQLPQLEVEIYDSRQPEVSWQGILQRIDGIGLDELTKTIPVRIIVDQPVVDTPNGQRALVRGMFVKCRFEIKADDADGKTKYVRFPSTSVKQGNYVWVVKGRTIHRVSIEAVDQIDHRQTLNGDKAEEVDFTIARLTDSIKAGELVVISPMPQPSEGSQVRFHGDPDPNQESEDTVSSKDSDKATTEEANDATRDEES